MALGVVGVLIILGLSISKLTTSGRWNTIYTSNQKKVEECCESATNLAFKVIKERINDYSTYYNNLPFDNKSNEQLQEIMTKEFMYFRMPANIKNDIRSYQEQGIDVQLDTYGTNQVSQYYNQGIVYRYDTETTPDSNNPLLPLQDMFKSLGGRVSVTCTGKIKQAFAILADSTEYKVGGVETPVRKVTGFASNLYDNVLGGVSGADGVEPITDEDQSPNIDWLDLIPNHPDPLRPNFQIIKDTIKVFFGWSYTIIGALISEITDKILITIMEKIFDTVGKVVESLLSNITGGRLKSLTPRGIAKAICGDKFAICIHFGELISKIGVVATKSLPAPILSFKGQVNQENTIEKKGFFEVETVVEYEPHYPQPGEKIVKKLQTQKEFIVADIQPVASDYTYFVANSKLLYENQDIENKDGWAGNESINFNTGGDLIISNLESDDWKSQKSSWGDFSNTITNIQNGGNDLKTALTNVVFPGLVRINGSNHMEVKIGMFPSLSGLTKENFKKIEIIALATKHRNGFEHMLQPCIGVSSSMSSSDRGFDWGYFGGSKSGTFWLPGITTNTRFTRTLFMGLLHASFPFSMRVEGHLSKVYSRICLNLVKLLEIKPIYIRVWGKKICIFPGIFIPFFQQMAFAKTEPYGFCKYPAWEDHNLAAQAWNPDDTKTLPTSLYSTAQYLKKCSYYYNSNDEFLEDMRKNRSPNGVFICDGITFVNTDSLELPGMVVAGRGMIVSAGSVVINGDITRIDEENQPSVFSIVARNGYIAANSPNKIDACLFADKGLLRSHYHKLNINGNLCVNHCNRGSIKSEVEVVYTPRNCRSSLLSMLRPVAKLDPLRYFVTLSSDVAEFRYVKMGDQNE